MQRLKPPRPGYAQKGVLTLILSESSCLCCHSTPLAQDRAKAEARKREAEAKAKAAADAEAAEEDRVNQRLEAQCVW